MWRLLIYELEAKKLGLMTKWKGVIAFGLYFAIGCCYIHPKYVQLITRQFDKNAFKN